MSSPVPPFPPPTPANPVDAATPAGDGEMAGPGGLLGLSVPWRWILGVGWSAVMGALGGIAQAAFLADTGPFWLTAKPLPFALPVLTLLALVGNWRRTITVSWVATASTTAVAVGDLLAHYRPVAVAEGICAASAALLTLAAHLSRPRATRADRPNLSDRALDTVARPTDAPAGAVTWPASGGPPS